MVSEDILPYLPYVGIVSLLITLFIIIYQFGKWRQKTEADREEIKKKLDALSIKIDKVPDEFLPVFIDMYKLYDKLKGNTEATKRRRTEDEQ
jgi:hypothetical protein